MAVGSALGAPVLAMVTVEASLAVLALAGLAALLRVRMPSLTVVSPA